MSNNGNGTANGNGNGGVTLKLSKWQATIFTSILGAALVGLFVSWLADRDWRTRTDERMQAWERRNYVSKEVYESDKDHLNDGQEQMRARIERLEDRGRGP